VTTSGMEPFLTCTSISIYTILCSQWKCSFINSLYHHISDHSFWPITYNANLSLLLCCSYLHEMVFIWCFILPSHIHMQTQDT